MPGLSSDPLKALISHVGQALRGGDLDFDARHYALFGDLVAEAEAIATICVLAHDLIEARRARDRATAVGDLRLAKVHGGELAALEQVLDQLLRELGGFHLHPPRTRRRPAPTGTAGRP